MIGSEWRYEPKLPARPQAQLLLRGILHQGVLVDISLWAALFHLKSNDPDLPKTACRLLIDRIEPAISGIIVHNHDGLIGIKSFGIRRLERDAIVQLFVADNPQLAALLDRDLQELMRQNPRLKAA